MVDISRYSRSVYSGHTSGYDNDVIDMCRYADVMVHISLDSYVMAVCRLSRVSSLSSSSKVHLSTIYSVECMGMVFTLICMLRHHISMYTATCMLQFMHMYGYDIFSIQKK